MLVMKEKLKRGEKKMYVIFFQDLISAYNNVIRRKVLDSCRRRGIIKEDEMELLIWLYDQINIRADGSVYSFGRGLNQGSILAPYLWNIAMDDYLSDIKQWYYDEGKG